MRASAADKLSRLNAALARTSAIGSAATPPLVNRIRLAMNRGLRPRDIFAANKASHQNRPRIDLIEGRNRVVMRIHRQKHRLLLAALFRDLKRDVDFHRAPGSGHAAISTIQSLARIAVRKLCQVRGRFIA